MRFTVEKIEVPTGTWWKVFEDGEPTCVTIMRPKRLAQMWGLGMTQPFGVVYIGPATSYAPKCRGSYPSLSEAMRSLEYGKVASS